jgi:myosin heavy subunit
MAEGIDVDVIHFADNTPILELTLGRPLGIFTLLDEESQLPKSTDWTLRGERCRLIFKA